MLGDGHRDAGPDSVFCPSASLVVKSFVGREGFPDVVINREGMRHRRAGSDADIPLEEGRTIPGAG